MLQTSNPVVKLALDRREAKSKPGNRRDGRRLALAIEGGGMRGVVSGGMVAALEQLNLLDSFDAIYGSSAGAISGAYFLASQARYGVTIFYEDINNDHFIDFLRIFRRQSSIVSVDYLLDVVCHTIKPLNIETILNSEIKFNVVSTSVQTLTNVVMNNFESADDLMTALRCSARIPFFAGPPVNYRGDKFLDASLYESIPFRSAIADGYTDILILLTRPFGDRRSNPNWIDRHIVAPHLRQYNVALAAHYLRRAEEYKHELDEIYDQSKSGQVRMLPIQIPSDTPTVHPLEKNRARLVAGAMAGHQSVLRAFTGEPMSLVEIIMPVKSVSKLMDKI